MPSFFDLQSHRISEWSILIIVGEFKNPSHNLLTYWVFLIYVERVASFLDFCLLGFEVKVCCDENYFVNHLQVSVCFLSDTVLDSKKFRRLLSDCHSRHCETDLGGTTKITKSNGESHKKRTQIHLLARDYCISKGAVAWFPSRLSGSASPSQGAALLIGCARWAPWEPEAEAETRSPCRGGLPGGQAVPLPECKEGHALRVTVTLESN